MARKVKIMKDLMKSMVPCMDCGKFPTLEVSPRGDLPNGHDTVIKLGCCRCRYSWYRNLNDLNAEIKKIIKCWNNYNETLEWYEHITKPVICYVWDGKRGNPKDRVSLISAYDKDRTSPFLYFKRCSWDNAVPLTFDDFKEFNGDIEEIKQ